MAADQPSIAVVGAGISGLSAALSLLDAGLTCTVYEASSRVGGRMESESDPWKSGQISEICGEFIDAHHHTMRGLVDRFGLQETGLRSAEPADSTPTCCVNGEYFTPNQVAAAEAPVYEAARCDVERAGFPTLYSHATPAARELDALTAYEWIEQRVPGGHGSLGGFLRDLGCTTEFGRDTTELSALNLVYQLAGPDAGGASAERYRIEGGNERLPRAIAAHLMAGGCTVRADTPLTRIEVLENGGFALSMIAGEYEEADHVILALPFSVLRTLDYSKAGFDQLKCAAIEKLGYGTNAKLQLQFDRRYWEGPGPWGTGNGNSSTDIGYQKTWESTRGQPGTSGILVNYTGGAAGGDLRDTTWRGIKTEAERFLAQLESVWPGVSDHWNGRADLSFPAGDGWRLGSYSCWLVGQYTTIAGVERERSGNCHFAGEHTSIEFQGFMEGAAREGIRAAREILVDLGR